MLVPPKGQCWVVLGLQGVMRRLEDDPGPDGDDFHRFWEFLPEQKIFTSSRCCERLRDRQAGLPGGRFFGKIADFCRFNLWPKEIKAPKQNLID